MIGLAYSAYKPVRSTDKIPPLPPRTRYLFDQFLRTVGRKGPREAADWKLFYRFIHAAHQGRLGWTGAQLERLLSGKGFDAKDASRLALIYEHGRGLLKAKPAFNYIKLRASNFDMDKGWDEINPSR